MLGYLEGALDLQDNENENVIYVDSIHHFSLSFPYCLPQVHLSWH